MCPAAARLQQRYPTAAPPKITLPRPPFPLTPRGPYEDYAASPHWSPPTLALACNSGIGSTDNAGWDRALAVMMDKDVPACFTSFSEGESKGEESSHLQQTVVVSGHTTTPWTMMQGLV